VGLRKIKPVIYFIRDEGTGFIKIGWARNAKVRMAELQIGNPRKLTLIGCFKSRHRWEARIHRHFSKNRIRGEWFEGTAELYATIANLERFGRLLCR
jgi:Meiotically Up-regulated Gene 113 (MUG113) protein